MSAADELAKKKAKLAELRKAKEARLASAPLGIAQVLIGLPCNFCAMIP
jgi:hypothetical protein